jgi:hypothetical protein
MNDKFGVELADIRIDRQTLARVVDRPLKVKKVEKTPDQPPASEQRQSQS